jgi:hypothetical protein
MANYVLVVKRCDNHLIVSVNGNEIFNEYYYKNRILDVRVDFTIGLQGDGFMNSVVIKGINEPNPPLGPHGRERPNPWEFWYSIEKDGTEIYTNHVRSSYPPKRGGDIGVVFSTEYFIILD